MRLTHICALLLIGAAPLASTASAKQMDNAAMPRDAAGYVAMAGASDLYEIQSSQIAQQKASSDRVRGFAGMMIQDHTMTTQQVMDAAKSAGMNPPPPMLMPMQQQMIDELNGLSGSAFDAAYIRQQRMAHHQALALHSGYAKNGDTPALRKVASTAVPIVKHHIAELESMPNR